MKDRRHFVVIMLMTVTLAVCVAMMLFVVFRARSGNQKLPSSQTYGLLLIDIDDSDLQSSFHVPQKGVYVLSAEEGSAASQAGVQSGDRLVSVNGTECASSSEFVSLFSDLYPQEIQLVLERGDESDKIELVLQESALKAGE